MTDSHHTRLKLCAAQKDHCRGITAAAIALMIRSYDWWTGRVSGFGLGWLLAPQVFPLYSLAGIKGIIEYLVSWDGKWYQVTKDG